MDATTAKPNYGFDVTVGDGYTQFHVVPPPFDFGAKFSIFFMQSTVVFLMMGLSLIVACIVGFFTTSWIVFWLVLAVGGPY